jgi:predicted amidohydrolase YtcJ
MKLAMKKINFKKLAISLCLSIASTATFAEPTAISNVRGYTFGNAGEFIQFSTLVFEEGKVLSIGDNLLIEQYPNATVIDGGQKTLLPGLIDSHGHVLRLGENLLQVDVRSLGSAKDAAKQVKQYADANPDLAIIMGRGWNQVLWPGKEFPTAKDLDEYVSNKPVMLARVDSHATWVNTKALELAGITKDTLDPPGGLIIRDANGEPTGVLVDNATSLVDKLIPETSESTLALSLNTAGKHLLSLGVTSTHDAGISKQVYDFYRAKTEQNKLPIRIYAMLAATDPELRNMLKEGHIKDKGDFLSIRSVKAYGDGALGSRGAALLAPYHDDPHNVGLLVTKQQDLKSLFDTVIGSNFQLNFHAIGDRANRLALDQFEDTINRLGGKNLRNRVEHAQIINPSDIPRFKQIGIVPAMQPTHATSDKNMAGDRLGEERLRGAYAWQTFLNQGSRVASGSDFPVELANPFFGLHAAVTRQDRENQPKQGWLPEEKMTVYQAFKSFTLDAAYAGHQDKVLGGLTKGKWADFILIDKDIFTIPNEQLWQPEVLQTWIAGKKVFTK